MKPVVVVLTSRFPLPLTKGDRLRAFHQIESLTSRSTVHLISLCLDLPKKKEMDILCGMVESVTLYPLSHSARIMNLLSGIMSRRPYQVGYFYDRKTSDLIRHLISQIRPDIIYTQLIRMAPYAIDSGSDATMHLDYMDSMVLNDLGKSMFNGWKKFLLPIERVRIKKYESYVANHFDQLYAISDRDREMFDSSVKLRITTIPNGVDATYFTPAEIDRRTDLGFSGNLSYPPNIAAASILCQEILPLLDQTSCWITGADLDEKSPMKGPNRCKVTGYIDDIRELYRRVKIYVAPIYFGSGTQNKILEAMACGTVCITTTFVNASIQATPDQEILIADSSEAFVEKINDLLSHPQKRQLIADKARKFVELNYNWDVHNQKLVESITRTEQT